MNLSTRQLFVLIASVSILSILSTIILYPATTGTGYTTYYTFENSPGTGYDWIAWRNGATYYFRDMESGVSSSVNTNATRMFEYLIGNASDGDNVFVKSGTYTQYGTILIDKQLDFSGAGAKQTTFIMSQTVSGNPNNFNITDRVQLHDIRIDANNTSTDAIFLDAGSDYSKVYDFAITQTVNDGIQIGDNSTTFTGAKIYDGRISESNGTGIFLSDNAVDIEILNVDVESVTRGLTDIGLYVLGGGGSYVSSSRFVNCVNNVKLGTTGNSAARIYFGDDVFYGSTQHAVLVAGAGLYDASFDNSEWKQNGEPSTYDAIYVESGAAFSRISIEGNNFNGQNSTTNRTRYALNNDGTDSYVTFKNNIILASTFTGSEPLVRGLDASTNDIGGNIGFNDFWWNGQNRTDVLANPISEASYIIDISGSYYRMKNTTTGQIVDQSTDASTILNNAIANASGKQVFVKAGNYEITSTVLISEEYGTCLIGESHGLSGQGTVFTAANNLNASILHVFYSAFNVVKGITIAGNSANNNASTIGLKITSTHKSIFEDLYITDTKGQGIYITGNSSRVSLALFFNKIRLYDYTAGVSQGFYADQYFYESFIDQMVIEGYDKGMTLEASSYIYSTNLEIDQNDFGTGTLNVIGGGGHVFSNFLFTSDLYASPYAMVTVYADTSSVNSIEFADGKIRGGTNVTSGLISQANGGFAVNDLNYHDILFEENMQYNLAFSGTITDEKVHHNSLHDATISTILIFGGAVVTGIQDNVGFVTENSGSWSGSNPVTVAHGLAGTPTSISITVNAVQPYTYSATVDATNIVIYHNAAGVLDGWWEATYVP